MAEAAGLHLAAALDGAGWHPAGWRGPGARPGDLFTPGYWADLAREAERGLLDFITIEDALGLQAASRYGGPDGRADQVRGRLDAVLIAAQVWNTDLSGYDAEGPLPETDPEPAAPSIIQGRARQHADPLDTARQWRALAEEKKLSIRELIIEVTGRQSFIGTPSAVAGQLSRFVQQDACDGFILVPHLIPAGLDEFAAKVVPLLQERGVLRTEYRTGTLRERLGLGPARPAAAWAAAALAAQGSGSAREECVHA